MRKLTETPKPAIKLFRLNEEHNFEFADLWGCGECGTLRRTKDEADRCCRKPNCIKCGSVIHDTDRSLTYCGYCYLVGKEEVALMRWEKMPTITYDGVAPLHDGEIFFSNLGDYLDCTDEEDRDEYLEVCNALTIGSALSAEDIYNFIDERLTEDFEDPSSVTLNESKELLSFLTQWLDKQTGPRWEPSGTKIIVEEASRVYTSVFDV